MSISKSKLEALVKELPDEANVEEVMYRLYLLQKIEAGESAIQKGETLSHQDAMGRLSNKWRNYSGSKPVLSLWKGSAVHRSRFNG